MKLLICFALLFVVASAQIEIDFDEDDEDSPFLPDGPGDFDEDGDLIDIGTTDEDGDEDDEDDDDDDDDDYPTEEPTSTSMPKHQCMRKFWACKQQLSHSDCDGKLKCFEEKSQCYQAYKANNPNMPTKSPEKMVCKNTFDSCLASANDTCESKLFCYVRKQKCYMKLKGFGRRRGPHDRHHHRRRPHHRRHHRHHRPTPCPKVMKCKMEWRKCIRTSLSCSDKLACFWKTHKCMEKTRPTPSPTPSVEPSATPSPAPGFERRWRPRRWDPKVVAKCKKNFEHCINGTKNCRKQIGCFIGMKRCIMEGHRPTPCPRKMKCKMEYNNCTFEANTCDEKLACMWRKHECYERARPTMPPPGEESRGYGYGRRRHWKPERKEKCKKELHKCINESSSCMEKMECFWEVKHCMMGRRPGPDRRMIKCKIGYINCTEEASNCEEKLACMWRKHECYERSRPTSPPTGEESGGYGYRRKQHWNPKPKEKCKKELHKCINESDSCMEKMKCFWEMKRCMIANRPGPHRPMMKLHILRKKLHQMGRHIHGIVTKIVRQSRPLFHRKRQEMGQRMKQIREHMRKWGSQWGNQMRQKFQGRHQSWKKQWQGKGQQFKRNWQGRRKQWKKHWQGKRQQWKKHWQGRRQQMKKKMQGRNQQMKKKWQNKVVEPMRKRIKQWLG